MRQSLRKKIVRVVPFLVALVVVVLVTSYVQTSNHPFLIVQPSDYQELRDRANRSPWSEMKDKAVRRAKNLSYEPDGDNARFAGFKLRDIMGYAALAYILDPGNQRDYVTKIQQTLNVALPDMQAEHDADEEGWDTNVAFQGGLFNAILALDIIYDDLPANDRSRIEENIEALVNDFMDNWGPANHSIAALWALYKGDSSTLERELQAYQEAWTVNITPDGVYAPGTGYGAERINGCTREHKALGMDVWAYHNYHDYSADERFIKLHEWLYGYSHTPDFRRMAFGDSSPHQRLLANRRNPANCSTQPYRAYKFGDRARRYVTWQMQDDYNLNSGNAATNPNGRLLTYILMRNTVPNLAEKEVPPSRVFQDGGAWFIEPNQSRTALAGALWNVKQDDVHGHKETNALFLSGYGSHLLSNSGYIGWGRGVEPFSWSYINRRAVSGNTGLIDYVFDSSQEGDPPEANDHQSKHGAGITESILAPTFDYAQGDSGDALPNGQHLRNFHFVHPTDEANGYWFLVDEFNNGNTVHLAFHPYSRTITTIAPDEEYQADIVDYENENLTDIQLSMFLGTEPTNVPKHQGVIAGPNLRHEYLYPTYDRGSGIKRIVTVLFPSDSNHSKASFSRIGSNGEAGYTGAKVDHGTVDRGNHVIDYILESDNRSIKPIDSVSLQAFRSFFRLVDNNLRAFYAVGTLFEYGTNQAKIGFKTNDAIALYLRDGEGTVISPVSQDVTLYSPNVNDVVLNGSSGAIVQAGDGWVTVHIPQGSSDVRLIQ